MTARAPLRQPAGRPDQPHTRRPGQARPAQAKPALPGPSPARPPPAPAGHRRHGFPRSHGPTEREVKAIWLKLPCRVRPNPSSATWIGSSPRAASEVEMPKEPERRRNPGDSRPCRDRPRAPRKHRRTPAGPCAPTVERPGAPAHSGRAHSERHRHAKGTRKPQKSWRFASTERRGGGQSCTLIQHAPGRALARPPTRSPCSHGVCRVARRGRPVPLDHRSNP
jgi:hypothetical protein